MSQSTASGPMLPTEPTSRVSTILEAACRVIARDGAHGLHMKAVATEAGVSKALVHYYFATRQELLRQAFGHAERELERAVAEELEGLPTARAKIERVLLVSIDADNAFGEQRALWNEVWSSLGFDDDLQPLVREWYTRWLDRLVQLVGEGLRDGSIDRSVSPRESGWRLAAVADGLDSLLYLGLLERTEASALIRSTLERELSPRR